MGEVAAPTCDSLDCAENKKKGKTKSNSSFFYHRGGIREGDGEQHNVKMKGAA